MLSKEFFEENGWKLKGKAVDLWFEFIESPITHTKIQDYYRYKPYKLWLNYGRFDGRMKVVCDFYGSQDINDGDVLFEGECINEEDYNSVMRMLKIKE